MDVHLLDGKVKKYEECEEFENLNKNETIDHNKIKNFIEKMYFFLSPGSHNNLNLIYLDGEFNENNIDRSNNLNAVHLLHDLVCIYEKNNLCLEKITFEEQLTDMGHVPHMCSQGRCVRLLCVINSMLSYFLV